MRQNEFRQFRLGLLGEDAWKQSQTVILMILSFRWGRNRWHVLGRHQIDEEMASHIDDLLRDSEFVDFREALEALKHLQALEDPA